MTIDLAQRDVLRMRNDQTIDSLLDALEATERERDRLREQGGELFLSGQVAKLREERDAAVTENDRLRNLPQSAFEAATMAAANATERQLREERDVLQGIVDDIASETGHCLLLDDEEHEAPTLPDWVRGIVKERDAAKGTAKEWLTENGPGGWVDDLRKDLAVARSERDAAIAKCEQLAAERPISVDMYDHVSAELAECKAKLAAIDAHCMEMPNVIRAAAKEPTP